MRFRSRLAAAALALGVMAGPLTSAVWADDATPMDQSKPAAPAASTFSPAQQAEIKALVKQYIADHPEIIGEAMQTLQDRQQQDQAAAATKEIKAHHDEIFNDGENTVVANPKGDVTVVEFLDYHCPYCKAAMPRILDITKRDKGVRLVVKEFPILGPGSVLAARWALAARAQGKYSAFHLAAMAYKGDLTESTLTTLATKAGLDAAKLSKTANSDEISSTLKSNLDLAQTLGIDGTPAFIIGDTLIPGAVPVEDLENAIKEARKNRT